MFKNDEPPVSLFSFQDIITSLTGIMVFFLLLLALNLIQAHRVQQENSPEFQELVRVREKNRLLSDQLAEMDEDVRRYRERMKKNLSLDESTLLLRRERLKKRRRELVEKVADTTRQRQEEENRSAALEQQNDKLKRDRQELARMQKENSELERENRRKRQQVDELRRQITKRHREVEVTIDSSIDKEPLLVECSQDRILIYDVKQQTTREYSRRNATLSAMMTDALKHLKKLPFSRYYFVFMVKPSAAAYFEHFYIRISQELSGANCGFEPILESEGVPHE